MSSTWFGSTETVGVSTKRRSSDSYSSRCEFAKDKRLSRFNVVGIQILRRTVVRELARHNKQIGQISPIGPILGSAVVCNLLCVDSASLCASAVDLVKHNRRGAE